MRPALAKAPASLPPLSILRHALHLNLYQQHYYSALNGSSLYKGQGGHVAREPDSPMAQAKIKEARDLAPQSYSLTASTGKVLETLGSPDGALWDQHDPPAAQKPEDMAIISGSGNAIGVLKNEPSEAQDRSAHSQHNRVEIMITRKQWRSRLSTFEQYLYESNLDITQIDRPLLIDNDLYSNDWLLWLELIRFQKRHAGIQGIQAIYKEIFRREKHIPAKGDAGKELWDRLFQAGHEDSQFLVETIAYATRLKRAMGDVSPRIYISIVGHALKVNPKSALKWHALLKKDFAPSIEDYKKLSRLSASWGSIASFRHIYGDYPLSGIYAAVIPQLCQMQMYEEAIKWHSLLSKHNDLPLDFDDLKPLVAYLAQSGDANRVQKIIEDLEKSQSLIIDLATKYVRKNTLISREIVSRQLGEVHGVAPKQLSDSFCARLFTTRLFTVKTVINGLQMMAVETIGPFSLREIASRDECYSPAILRHLDDLQNAGITLEKSTFSTLLQKLVRTGNDALLKSLVASDLHPDTLEDLNLQEKLLAQYYEAGDQLQVERTLAILTIRCSSQEQRALWWWNFVFRSHVTLQKLDDVKSIIGTMQQAGIPISSRSSRHLRVCWLTKRQKGRRAERTQELSLIIRATQNTLRSGGFVPIIAWREIMRRLGMAGRLVEFENLALWLVDYYSSPTGQQSLPTTLLLQSGGQQQGMEAENLSKNHNPQKFLNILFTTAAQHAIVAWGFQQEVKAKPAPHHSFQPFRKLELGGLVPNPSRPIWTWGLVLLRKLQERGVPIQQATISRICKHRLAATFGHGISNRPINRRGKWINEVRAGGIEQYTLKSYVREMEDIWGQDLFRHQIQQTDGFGHRRSKGSAYWVEKVRQGSTLRGSRGLIHGDSENFDKEASERPQISVA